MVCVEGVLSSHPQDYGTLDSPWVGLGEEEPASYSRFWGSRGVPALLDASHTAQHRYSLTGLELLPPSPRHAPEASLKR